jgi:NAD(P)-dependent dehydrogenase (short-subunit alcohol dehydrogenase family)
LSNVLVVGARRGSIGEAVADLLREQGPYDVWTAGLSGEENFEMDVIHPWEARKAVSTVMPRHIICTAGINWETEMPYENPGHMFNNLRHQFLVNCAGPMFILNEWLRLWGGDIIGPKHFVAISSNSATVPRSRSMGYCASKAALSQAIRCAGRALPPGMVAWAIEPGWVEGTPMSQEVEERLGSAPHMRGGSETNRHDIARFISEMLNFQEPQALNGMVFQLDGGEQ